MSGMVVTILLIALFFFLRVLNFALEIEVKSESLIRSENQNTLLLDFTR